MSDRGAELDAALQNATDAPAILAALGAAIAHNEDRAARAPTLADLGAAVLPFDAVQEAVARSSAAVGTPALQLMAAPLGGTAAAAPPMPGNLALYWIWLPVSTARPDLASDDTCEAIHRAWLAAAEPRPRHPLAPLVDAWQRLAPVPAMAVADYDRDLILSRQFATVRDDAEGYYLARFKTAAHRAGGQLLLGFEHPEMDGPTLPADVWNLHLAEAEKRGPGLPAALRIFLASIVHVPLSARASADPFTPPVYAHGTGRPPLDPAPFPGTDLRAHRAPAAPK